MKVSKSRPSWKHDLFVEIMLIAILALCFRVAKLSEKPTVFLSPLGTEAVIVIEKTTMDDIIAEASAKYGVKRHVLHCVLDKESSYNPNAVGDNGKAQGPAQFWPATWKGFRKLMGLPISERTNFREAVNTLAWAIADGRGNNWTPILDGRCPIE